MKVLLLGEYSRLHNSLKEGLEQLGHKVIIAASTDGFKKYPVTYNLDSYIKNNKYLLKFSVLFLKIFNINLVALETAFKAYNIIKKIEDVDIVQLINESSINTYQKLEIKLLKLLFKKSKKQFLLSCGEDFYSISYALNKNPKYSILSPYLMDKSLKKNYKFTLRKVSKSHKKLHLFIKKHTNGVIASDIDYHLPLKQHKNYLGLIPNPINIDKLQYKSIKIGDKINIFHGINSGSSIRKGNHFFTDALFIIKKKYGNKINIIETRDLPYNEYIKSYNQAHILLDQVYAYDQGYNALEAMAKGKVVFTGAEQEWLDYYNLKEDTVAINALPDVDYLVKKLEWLINNPEQIQKISENARQFIEEQHNYKEVAKQYLATWQNN